MISATGTGAVVILEKGSVSSLREYSIYSTHHTNGTVVHLPAL